MNARVGSSAVTAPKPSSGRATACVEVLFITTLLQYIKKLYMAQDWFQSGVICIQTLTYTVLPKNELKDNPAGPQYVMILSDLQRTR
jgi:hypothetical protein